ncbi:hypothetical protein PRJ39_16375 [Lysobacter enzymogenes]|uniref:hypothetical protein n=1 Tax=Lysobacter enzymogenes TaxID=69 RepID=UPI003749E82A
MRQRGDLPESAPGPADAGQDAGAMAPAWPREPISAQRLRDAEVAQAQATLKRELVRVYAQSCGACKPKQ